MLRRAYVLLTLLVLATLFTLVGNRAYAVGDLSLLFDVSQDSQASLTPLQPGDFNIRFINRNTLTLAFTDTSKHIFQNGGGPTFQELFGGQYFDRDSDSTYQWVKTDGSALFVDFFNDRGAVDDAIKDPEHFGIDTSIASNMQELEVTIAFERTDDNDGGTYIYLNENYEWEDGVGGDTGLQNKTTAKISGERIRDKDNFNVALRYNPSPQSIVTIEEVGRSDRTYISCPDNTFRKGDCGSNIYIQLRPGDTPESLATLTTFTTADFHFRTLDGNFPSPEVEAIRPVRIAGGGSETVQTDPSGGESPDSAPTCESQGGPFAWLLCSAFNLAFEGITYLYNNLIEPLLSFAPLDSSSTNPEQVALRSVWTGFRTLANIGFVIVFIIMIFGQATSIGVDTYTVKKVLPRLAIGVILVQLSFFIVAGLVDLFNVLGAGVDGLITQPLRLAGIDYSVSLGGETGALGSAALVTVAAGSAVGLFALSPLILGVLIGVVLAVVTLLFRQLLIILLIVTAPIAMVAFVLPNTEKFFQTWGSLLIKALLMYPLIVAFIALGEMGAVLASSAFPETGSVPGQVMGLVALAAPYLLIPFTFRFAGGALAGVAAFAQGKSRSGAMKRFTEGRQDAAAARRQRAAGGNLYSERNPFARRINRLTGGAALGFRGRFGLGQRGQQATALRRGASIEQTIKNNPALQQLGISDDDGNAVMALSGGSGRGAEEAARELFTDENGVFDQVRAARAVQAARAVGINRANAEAALTTMAQNKSRAVRAGHHEAVARGIERLAAGNDQLRTSLENSFQYNSRGAGRIDLGGGWRYADDDPVVARRGQLKSSQDVMRDGLGRTEVPALVRGHKNQVQQAATVIETLLSSDVAADRREGAVRMLELHNALPYATGENAAIINRLKQRARITPGENLADRLAADLRLGGPGEAIPEMTAQALQSEARVYDQSRSSQDLGGTGPGATPA